MPELPEVGTVVRTLEHQLDRVMITGCEVLWNNIIDYPDVVIFCRDIVGKTIQGYYHYGRYMRFNLGNMEWICHAWVKEKSYVQQPQEPYDRRVHVTLQLSDGRRLRYHDTRKLGKMYLYEEHVDVSSYLCSKNVGYDAFDGRVMVEWTYHTLHRRKTILRVVLPGQRYIAGIGNIYTNEICLAMHTYPETTINHLRKKNFKELVYRICRVLNGAIRTGGTTIHLYIFRLGVDGRFRLKLKVHAKKGEAYPVYGTKIKKIAVAARRTCFRPTYQRRR